MGSILPRKRKDGSTGYTVNIRIKQGGKVIHREAETFDREQAAIAWMKKRETELAKPGALDKATGKLEDPTLAEVIGKYNEEKQKEHGKTKTQVLRAIGASKLAAMKCSEIQSQHVIAFAQSLEVKPQTVSNYLAHLSAIFAVARPAWGYPLDVQAIQDARVVAKRLGITTRARERNRRPTLDELDKLLRYYQAIETKRKNAVPMTTLIPFAIFSTRRQEEICRVTGADLDREHMELLVRDMKNPGEKVGNDVRTTITPEVLRILDSLPKTEGTLFPHNSQSISTSFTRACKFLGIEDLHFHDLRHEGITRLFEMGWTIPQVATVSGHRTWTSLKRYTHIKQSGDKYRNWSWLERIKPHG